MVGDGSVYPYDLFFMHRYPKTNFTILTIFTILLFIASLVILFTQKNIWYIGILGIIASLGMLILVKKIYNRWK